MDQDEILIQAFGRAQGIKVPPKVSGAAAGYGVEDLRADRRAERYRQMRARWDARAREREARSVLVVERADAVEALRLAVSQRARLEEDITELVEAARSMGSTWEAIGEAAGLSRDGAVTRWGRK